MNYLVIDLEMCNVPRDYRSRSYKYANETIQIGAVLLDEEFKRIGTLSQYVHPEHGVIDPFIQNLTGIRNSQVKKAPRTIETISEGLIFCIFNSLSQATFIDNPDYVSSCFKGIF